MKHTPLLLSAALGLAVTLPAASALADVKAAKDLYKGRTITLLVGYSAGGTYGQTSQLLARHLDKTFPSKPNIVVQHMPGAGGIKSTNYAYNVMPKNGLNLLMPPEMTLVSQLLRPNKVKFKTTDFIWLGRVFGGNQVMGVRRDTGITSIEDAKKTSVVVASTGTGSPTFLVPKMLNGLVGTKFRIVTGYRGSAKTSLSVEQGETFGMSNSWVSWKANRGAWVKGGNNSYLVLLAQVGFEREPDLPNVPLLTELAQSKDDKAAAAMLSTASIIGRGLVLPPGAPKWLVQPLRDAFWKGVNTEAFKKEVIKRRLDHAPLKGGHIQKIIQETADSMSPEVIAKTQKLVFGK